MSAATATIVPLRNPVRPYPWGSRTAIADLLGEPSPASGPQAELWMGAHPGDPSRLPDGSTLTDLIAADPVGELGGQVAAEFDGELPFLVKLLAADAPLSLQVHPTTAQARAGYAAEDAAGIALDSPTRNYRDRRHKPEMICALSPFTGLVGFREIEGTVAFLRSLGVAALAPTLAWLDAGEVAEAVRALLAGGDGAMAEAVRWACQRPGPFRAERDTVAGIGAAYPGDPGVVVAAMLNLVRLRPGEAVFLPAGVPHAYLSGFGIEVLANSDNVLRGGLTGKHVDVDELLRVLDARPGPAPVLSARRVGAEHVYDTPAREFRLSRVNAAAELDGELPQILVATDGVARAHRGAETVVLRPGRSVYLPAGPQLVRTEGVLHRVTPDLGAPGVA